MRTFLLKLNYEAEFIILLFSQQFTNLFIFDGKAAEFHYFSINSFLKTNINVFKLNIY